MTVLKAEKQHQRGATSEVRESILFASTHTQKLKTASIEVFPVSADSVWSDSSTVHITQEMSTS